MKLRCSICLYKWKYKYFVHNRTIRKLRCLLGLHKWIQNRPLYITDIFLPVSSPQRAIRTCKFCGKKEEWLPGFGGSETGCWINHVPRDNGL